MGNFGCCQGNTTIAEESKSENPEPIPLSVSIAPAEIESAPQILAELHPSKSKKRIKQKKSPQNEFSEKLLVEKKPENRIRFSKSDFIHLNHGNVETSYTIVSSLGKGSFGCVYKAKHKITDSYRAVKVLKKENFSEDCRKKLLQEVDILKDLDHPNILKVFEVIEDDNSINIITELCTGGELFDRIVSNKGFSENKAAFYMLQIMSAVLTCHDKDIVHRDLKPENILFTTASEDSPLKVIDFGTSRKLEANTTLSSLTGTVLIT
jgi:calcium-dependent protein kinase